MKKTAKFMIASILALWGQGCLAQDKPTMGWSS